MKQRNPNAANACLVDYAPGTVVNGWNVVRRVRNTGNSNATWLCTHTCEHGGTKEIQGIVLRSRPPQFCADCRPRTAPSQDWRSR